MFAVVGPEIVACGAELIGSALKDSIGIERFAWIFDDTGGSAVEEVRDIITPDRGIAYMQWFTREMDDRAVAHIYAVVGVEPAEPFYTDVIAFCHVIN
jgi:hypothetical protein